MSRCVPFSPPGYEKNYLSGVAVIEQFELEWLKHVAKTEKRERKKRIRKHKGSERLGRGNAGSGVKETSRNAGTGNLDGSDVTAEHEKAVVSGSHCYLSDETYRGAMKRDREAPGHDIICNRGRIIRIKLPEQKSKECNVATCKPCSAYACQDAVRHWKSEVNQPFADEHGVQSCSKSSLSNASQLSSSKRVAISAQNQSAKPESESAEGRTMSSKSSCEVLMVNWNPLPLQASMPAGEGNEDWVFNSGSKLKRLKMTADEYSIPWPHIHCLPEHDTYVLPYTVIF